MNVHERLDDRVPSVSSIRDGCCGNAIGAISYVLDSFEILTEVVRFSFVDCRGLNLRVARYRLSENRVLSQDVSGWENALFHSRCFLRDRRLCYQ